MEALPPPTQLSSSQDRAATASLFQMSLWTETPPQRPNPQKFRRGVSQPCLGSAAGTRSSETPLAMISVRQFRPAPPDLQVSRWIRQTNACQVLGHTASLHTHTHTHAHTRPVHTRTDGSTTACDSICLYLSLSVSLTHTYTHTHTHTRGDAPLYQTVSVTSQ